MIRATILLALIFAATAGAAQEKATPTEVSICDLLREPQHLDGRSLIVRGQVPSGRKGRRKPVKKIEIVEPFSTVDCVAVLKVKIPPLGANSEVRLEENFETLQDALYGYTSIEGTFQGRFEYLPRSSSNDFRIAGRLVLESILTIEVHVLRRR